MELATVFMAHSMATFANAHCRLAFVMPRGVLTQTNIKIYPQKIPFRRAIQTYRVLGFVGRSPTFECAILRALCRQDPLTWQPKREARGPRMERQIAEPRCALERGESKIEDCGKRGACVYLRIESGPFDSRRRISPTKPSKYEPAFKQGATILPRSFYFVRISGLDGWPDVERQYWAETDPEQAAEAKKPIR